eukprot:COSAG02_NODE_3162_length_7248_cov_147.217793_4_plen_234_part_00
MAFADPRPGACTAATYSASNLSGFRLVGGDEYSNSTTRDGCLAACCGRADCTAWNYHLSSADPAHNVRSCWLSAEAEPLVTLVSQDPGEPENADVWVGGSRRRTHTRNQPQHPRFADIPQCDGSDYGACRKSLWKYVFNTTTGELPSKAKPDYLVDMPDWEMKGFPGPGQGTGVRMQPCMPWIVHMAISQLPGNVESTVLPHRSGMCHGKWACRSLCGKSGAQGAVCEKGCCG